MGSIRSRVPNGLLGVGGGISGGGSNNRSPRGMGGGAARLARLNVSEPMPHALGETVR
ncbi:Uncharacterised protein [Mycobacteroides abscessus subsp. abscessus]|nr:Uncharacterised protein [Mycobacteroides abscessus subsp. abscessus]